VTDTNLNEGTPLGTILEFTGTPTYEKYFSQDSSWGAYVVNTEINLPQSKMFSQYDFLTDQTITIGYQINLTGKMQQLITGLPYTFKAKLDHNKKYGYSYTPISISQTTPKTFDEQRKFLETIVTPLQADALLSVYPNIVEDTIAGKEIDLNLTKGIKEFTWGKIREKIISNYAIADILTLLSPLGISFSKIHALVGFESNAELLKQTLLDDPYIITQIDGISFKGADSIALKLNPSLKVSNKRVVSFIKNYLREVGDNDGHTWVTVNELQLAIKENLIECEDLLDSVLKEDAEKEDNDFSKLLHVEEDKIGLKYYWWVEQEIWRMVGEIVDSEPLDISQEEIDNGIYNAEQDQGFNFTEEQKELLISATKNNFVIITGKAGVGKTTLLRGLLNIYKSYSIGACALSAKASKRITELTGFDAKTMHRTLGADGRGFEFNSYNKLFYNIVVLDEGSMVNNYLYYSLLSAIDTTKTKFIISGDSAQLPPLGAGNAFSDLLEKENLPSLKLTKILRQSENSGIIVDCNKIRDGINPIKNFTLKEVHGVNEDMYYMFRDNKEDLNRIAINTYLKTIQTVGIDNCYILTTRREGALNSSLEISKKIQEILIPGSDVPSIQYGESRIFKLGAKVIHIINDYDTMTFNGDMGTIKKISKDTDGEYLEVEYPEKITKYYKPDLKKLELAYGLSVHKFQGSEAKVIIGILDNAGYMLLDRTMLYTMLTRGKEKVLLLAEPYAYKKAVSEDKGNNRQTWMKFL